MIPLLALTLISAQSYALVIGNNVPWAGAGEDLETLHYADDDAAAFSEWARATGADVTLLSVLDRASQARFPDWAAQAVPPTLVELQRAVSEVKRRMGQDQAVVWIYFSGHGALSANREAELVMLDGGLTQKKLYALLDELGQATVHLVVDACHAEAVVRPRDASKGRSVATDPADLELFKARSSLARYPRVGAVIATAIDQNAHEWDVYQSGVFTHQLLSALRGVADVNGDARIEYSEAHAFLGAANREVADPRARVEVMIKAPGIDEHTPLVDFSRVRSGFAFASGADLPRFSIENDRGERLLDAHLERAHEVLLMLPSDSDLFVRTPSGEATFRLAGAERKSLGSLRLAPLSTRSRGSLSSALSRGLFAAPFGPFYYRGYVDSSGDLAVSFAAPAANTAAGSPRKAVAIALFATAGASTVAAIITGAFALSAARTYETTPTRATGEQAMRTYTATGAAFIATAILAVGAASVGLGVYPWVSDKQIGIAGRF